MSGAVYYTVELRDLFSAAANAISKASQAMQKAVGAAGGAVNQTEKAVAAAAAAFNSTAAAMQNVARNAAQAQGGFSGVATAADRAAAAASRAAAQMRIAARDAGWINAGYTRGPGGEWNRASGPAGPVMGPPGKHGSGWSNLWHGVFALTLGGMAVRGVDHLFGRAGTVDTMRQKLGMALGPGSEGQVDQAYDKAFALSGKYRNTTVAENLKIINDLRANLPETMDHILKESTEPFVKLHSFFKAWEGGKHAGVAESALRDISAAIRAGELLGNLTGAQLSTHAQSIAMGRVVFGDKFKVPEYFQGVQQAAVALASADQTFKTVDFPVLVQRLGTRGATSLTTMFQKLMGIRMPQYSLEAWRELGMVDLSQVEFDKSGKIKAGSAAGKKWLLGSDIFAQNLTTGIFTELLPKIGKSGRVPGLGGGVADAMSAAYKAGDVDKLVKVMSDFRRSDPKNIPDLSRVMAVLGFNPTAIRALEELFFSGPSIMRDRFQMLRANQDTENFKNYDKAKQTLSAQMDRLFIGLTGKDFMGNVIGTMDAVSSGLQTMGKIANDNPVIGRVLGWGTLGLAGWGGARLLGWMTGLHPLKWLVGGFADATRSVGGLKAALLGLSGQLLKLGSFAVGAAIIDTDAFAKATSAIGAMTSAFNDWIMANDAYKKRMADFRRAEQEYAAEQARPGYKSFWEQLGSGEEWGKAWDRFSTMPEHAAGGVGMDMISGVAEREIAIRIEAPASIAVEVHGKVDAIQGRGEVPLSVTSPRGEAAPTSP